MISRRDYWSDKMRFDYPRLLVDVQMGLQNCETFITQFTVSFLFEELSDAHHSRYVSIRMQDMHLRIGYVRLYQRECLIPSRNLPAFGQIQSLSHLNLSATASWKSYDLFRTHLTSTRR